MKLSSLSVRELKEAAYSIGKTYNLNDRFYTRINRIPDDEDSEEAARIMIFIIRDDIFCTYGESVELMQHYARYNRGYTGEEDRGLLDI